MHFIFNQNLLLEKIEKIEIESAIVLIKGDFDFQMYKMLAGRKR